MREGDVWGLKAFFWQLDTLDKNIDRRILRVSLLAGARVFRREIRRHITPLPISPRAKQILRRSLVVRPIRRRGGLTSVGIFFRTGWRLSEAEVEVHDARRFRVSTATTRGGRSRGREEGLRYIALDDAFFWRWIEFGTAERRTKEGWARGRIPEMPFIRPAIEAAERAAIRAIYDRMDEEIDRAIAKSLQP